MTDITLEQRARELLAAEHRKCERYTEADLIDAGDVTALGRMALNAIKEALRLSAGADWRPIETAPKDGTRIIIGATDQDGDGGVSVAGYWIEELEDGVDYMGNDGGFTDVDFQVFQPGRSFGAESYRYSGRQPTHWKPLPAAPRHEPGEWL